MIKYDLVSIRIRNIKNKFMDLGGLKLKNLGIDKEKFGKIFTFVDFGNVNYWYEKDRRDWAGNILKDNEKLIINIEKLGKFINLFSEQKRGKIY